jgi:hypothetical protein
MEMFHSLLSVSSENTYRYIRFHLPADTFALNELTFYTCQDRKMIPIDHVKIHTSVIKPFNETDKVEFILDSYSATGCKGHIEKKYIDIDLGNDYSLCAIGYTPYQESGLSEECTYELLYWENGWVSAGKQRGNNSFLCFEKVPTNALFLLKNRNLKSINSSERIFIYRNNEVLWM